MEVLCDFYISLSTTRNPNPRSNPQVRHKNDLLDAMGKLAGVLKKQEGLIEETAWLDESGKIVATSVWESEEAFKKALPVIGNTIKDVPFDEWEAKPRELFRLKEWMVN